MVRATLSGTVLLAGAGLLGGCVAAPAGPAAPTNPIGAAAIDRLDAVPCADDAFEDVGIGAEDLLCGVLTVPLDWSDPASGDIELEVTLNDVVDPEGVLLLIGGGPGGSSTWSVPVARALMPEVAERMQLVAMDLRGTGAGALDCPAVQVAAATSDILPAPREAVVACAAEIAPWRAHLSTADTVEDLEALRQALGGPVWIPDGTSYGTFVAQRYAMQYPNAVEALVLDSTVSGYAVDPFLRSSMRGVPDLLESACVAQDCATDPVEDLVAVLAAGYDELRLFNAIVGLSASREGPVGLVDALASARGGDLAPLDGLVEQTEAAAVTSLWIFSAATHIGTLCVDSVLPWDATVTDPDARIAVLDEALAALPPEATWPFSSALAGQVATMSACVDWPEPWSLEPGELPDVPILILAGGRDLSTPLSDAEAIAAELPMATLAVFPDAGHGLQTTADGAAYLSDYLLALRG